MRRILLLFFPLLRVTPVLAWGPYTHSIFNEQVLVRLQDDPATSFLARGRCAEVFVAAASVCDLTFDVMALGKSHQVYDDLLHNREFLDHLLDTAEWKNDLAALAFALSLRSHQVSDARGSRPEGPFARNSFDWPLDRDFQGMPATDPAGSALEQLEITTANLNKILLDSVMYGRRRSECSYAPFIDAGLLIEAVTSYPGAGAVPRFTDAERNQIRTDLEHLSWKFTMSFQVLESAIRKLAGNAKLQAGIREAFAIPDDRALVDLDGCVDLIVTDIQDALRQRKLSPSSGDPIRLAPWCGESGSVSDLQSFSQGVLSMAWSLPHSYVTTGAGTTSGSLEDLNQKIYFTFFTAIAEPEIEWSTLRERIRAQVPRGPVSR